jgi:prepilin-type processing-associated H-X9-DG protein
VLGRKIGEGEYNRVFAIDGHPDKVVKFVQKDKDGWIRTRYEILEDQMHGSRLLEERGIPQRKVTHIFRDKHSPYAIVENLEPGQKTFIRSELKAGKKKLSTGQQRAVLQLYDDMAGKNLVWLDGHVENLYFQKKRGTKDEWIAGVLDQDMVADFSNKKKPLIVRERLGVVETFAGKPAPRMPGYEPVKSMGATVDFNRRFQTASDAMSKMLENKKWIGFDPSTGQFVPDLIDAKLIKELQDGKFKNLRLWSTHTTGGTP